MILATILGNPYFIVKRKLLPIKAKYAKKEKANWNRCIWCAGILCDLLYMIHMIFEYIYIDLEYVVVTCAVGRYV